MVRGLVKQFLAEQKVGPLVKSHTKELAYLRAGGSTVGDALQGLAQNQVLSEPILDVNDEYSGCVSCGDILRSLVAMLDEREGKSWTENVSKLTADDMLALGRVFCETSVDNLKHQGELWLLEADKHSSLLDAVMEGMRAQDPHVHHRIFLCSAAHGEPVRTSIDGISSFAIAPGTERASATGLKVHGVLSQSDVIALLAENKQALGVGAAASVEKLGLDNGCVFTVPATMPTLEAFGDMVRDHKSSLGITDSSGNLIGNLSASDLRGLSAEDFPMLLLPVAEFLLIKTGKAVKGQPVADPAAALAAALPVAAITRETTLGDLLDLLVSKHYHRVYVVGTDGKPISIITLTDLLKLVTSGV